jgi:hypothetical protein
MMSVVLEGSERGEAVGWLADEGFRNGDRRWALLFLLLTFFSEYVQRNEKRRLNSVAATNQVPNP